MSTDRTEREERLWPLAVAPASWALHLFLSYGTAAVHCAKVAGPGGSLSAARVAIAIYTLIALAAVGLAGWRALRDHRQAGAGDEGADTASGRRRFLALTAVLLSALSATAIIYQALAAVFIEDCW